MQQGNSEASQDAQNEEKVLGGENTHPRTEYRVITRDNAVKT